MPIVAAGSAFHAVPLVGDESRLLSATPAKVSSDVASASTLDGEASGTGGCKAQPDSTIEMDRSPSGGHVRARVPGRLVGRIRIVEATRKSVPAPGVMR